MQIVLQHVRAVPDVPVVTCLVHGCRHFTLCSDLMPSMALTFRRFNLQLCITDLQGVAPSIRLSPADFQGSVGPVTIRGGRTVRVYSGMCPSVVHFSGPRLAMFSGVDIDALAKVDVCQLLILHGPLT